MLGLFRTRRAAGTCHECTTHVCRTCEVEKSVDEFYARKRPDGTVFHRLDCKVCVLDRQHKEWAADPETHRRYAQTYYANNSWRARDSSLRKKYGISYAEFVEMYRGQDGRCALCRREIAIKGQVHVDHDHQTGKVRALLCHHCNTGIGNLQDDPDLLLAAAMYVLHHREEHRDVAVAR